MDFYPLTQSQKLIYDMEKFAGGSIANICGSMLFSEKVDTQAIEHAIHELYRINDALRIHVKESAGTVQQYVSDYESITAEIKQFATKDELHTFGKSFAKEPTGTDGNLCQFVIVILPEQTGVLVKLHHLIGDAWTLSLIGSQLHSILRGEIPETYSYIDHIKTEDAYINSRRYQRDQFFLRRNSNHAMKRHFFQKSKQTVFVQKEAPSR